SRGRRDRDDRIGGAEHECSGLAGNSSPSQPHRDTEITLLGGFSVLHVDRQPETPIAGWAYLRAEMMTVFENASPMLSVEAPGMFATARCTMRRSYGLSGPSC